MPEFQVKSNAVQLKLQLIRNNNEEIAKNTETIHKAAETLKEKGKLRSIFKKNQWRKLRKSNNQPLYRPQK